MRHHRQTTIVFLVMATLNVVVNNSEGQESSPLVNSSENGTTTGITLVEDVSKVESRALKNGWEAWHQRVSEAVELRSRLLAGLVRKHTPPLLVKVSFVVTSEGLIRDIRCVEKSSDTVLNLLVAQSVKSLDGDRKLLLFPEGSQRMNVSDTVTIRHNFDRVMVPTTDGSPYSIEKKYTE